MRRSSRFVSDWMVCRLGATLVTATIIALVTQPIVVKAGTPANKVVATIPVAQNPVYLAVTPASDAVYVTSTRSNTVTVIDTSLNTVVATIAVGQTPFSVSFTPDGQTAFVTNATDSTVSVISTATKSVTTTFAVGHAPWAGIVTPDGKQLYVTVHGPFPASKKDGEVWIIDTKTFAVLNKIRTQSRPTDTVFTADGTSAYVLDENSFVTHIDTVSQTIVQNHLGSGLFMHPIGLAISPDASTLYVANYTTRVQALSTVSGSLLKSIRIFPSTVPWIDRSLTALSITPKGDFLYVLGEYANDATMVDLSTGKPSSSTISLPPYPWSSAIAPNGNYLYISALGTHDNHGTVTVVDIRE